MCEKSERFDEDYEHLFVANCSATFSWVVIGLGGTSLLIGGMA